MRHLTRRSAIGLALAAAAGMATAQDKKWDDVIADAKKEKTVVFYTGAVANKCVDAIIANFTNAYGIEVQTLKARGGELHERIRVEQASGRFLVDVEWNGPPPIFLQGQAGQLEPLGKVPNMANLLPGFEPEQFAVPLYANYIGMLVHQSVKDEDIRSWKNLADPKWQGKIVSDVVDTFSAGNAWFDVTQKAFGDGMHEGIVANKPIMTRDFAVMQRRIAAGELLIHINQVATDAFAARGLPVRWVVPAEGAPAFVVKVSVPKNAPHPNAARLFINHLLDAEQQALCGAEGMGPIVKGAVDKVDPALRRFLDVKKLGEQSPDPKVVTQSIEAAKKIYAK